MCLCPAAGVLSPLAQRGRGKSPGLLAGVNRTVSHAEKNGHFRENSNAKRGPGSKREKAQTPLIYDVGIPFNRVQTMRNPLIVVVLPFLFLVGCASTGVIPMDQDSYMIGKKDGSPGLGVSLSNKAEVYKEANQFCRAKGLEVKTLQATTIPSRPGQLGSTELQFRCVAPGGVAQPLEREPDQIIEQRVR